jgi:arylsulfatase A-like enzyme
VVRYIRDYFRKATSGHGYGHAILSLPHFLVLHLPEPGRAGSTSGWGSSAYREALRNVDSAIGSVLDLYKELGLLGRTTVIVTGLSGAAGPAGIASSGGRDGAARPADQSAAAPRLPWIAWGVGIKTGYSIKQPVSIMDTGATVLRTLNLETHTEWESHAVEEIFKAPRTAAMSGGDHAH